MSKKKILFVCIENSNRSQMAEAFARMRENSTIEIWSAGSRPSGKVNPRAVQFMKEKGYDLSTHRSKSLDEIPEGPYEYVITMGCGEECPFIPAKHREDWALTDPKTLDDEGFRAIRDEIEKRVMALVGQF
ncbi:MAG TPA: arsenate reductase ArsC [Balneolales bacterium]|nr:arsenate reductase ArsC [Balneolales bacterium]